MLNSLVY
jgi:hypothetical protein